MMNKILQVDTLSYDIAYKKLLTSVSFSLDNAKTVALIGKNGAGKTTLLNCLTGYKKKSAGKIIWKGKNLEDISQSELCEIVAYCGDAPEPFYSCSVRDMILFGRSSNADFFGNYSNTDHDLVLKFAKKFDLIDLLQRDYSKISLGERQRVNLAMTMISEPEMLLLDEPTAHLDPNHKKQLMNNINDLAHKHNVAVLAVLHDINYAVFFDRILVLSNNTLAFDGKPETILTSNNLNKIFGEDVFQTIECNSKKINLLNV